MRLHALIAMFALGLSGLASAEAPDTTFNGNGRYLYGQFGDYDFRAVATLPLSRGKSASVFQFPQTTGYCAEAQCIAIKLFAADGTLQAVGTFANDIGRVTAAAVDASGYIVVTAQTNPGPNGRDMLVARFNGETLTRDLRFGNGTGWVRVSFNARDEFPAAVAIDRLDRIVIAGSTSFSATDSDFLITRLLGTGALDTSFNGNGHRAVAFDLSGSLFLDQANAVTITRDGRILAVGSALDNAASRLRIGVVRLNDNGSLDTTLCPSGCAFNAGYSAIREGRTVYVFGSGTTHADEALSVDAIGSGGYLIAGATYADDGSNRRGAVARFNNAGVFAGERVAESLGNNGQFRSVKAVDATATRVLVAGNSGPNDNFLLVQAFDASLAPVVNYGNCHPQNNGFCPIFASELADWGPDAGVSIAVDAGGRPLLYAQGIASEGGLPALMTARYTNTSGPKPDTLFRAGFN